MGRYKHILIIIFTLIIIAPVAHAGLVTPPGCSYGDQFHWAFITDGTTQATNTSIAHYNNFVTTEANRPSAITSDLDITWLAVASTVTVVAHDNVNVTAPVFLLDGTMIAAGAADLWDGTIGHPIDITQFMAEPPTYPGAPLGTDWDPPRRFWCCTRLSWRLPARGARRSRQP
jgi:hypothetical protein